MLLVTLTLSAVVAGSWAIVCPPNYCDQVTQPLLDCKGGVMKNAGFCGCTDICAKVEGESCSVRNFIGIPNTEVCDQGLFCSPVMLEGQVQNHVCMTKSADLGTGDNNLFVSRRKVPRCDTACEKKSLQCTLSMVIYEGQWFAQCDDYGNFRRQQCDNTKHCFCVDIMTGEIEEGSKVLGSAQC